MLNRRKEKRIIEEEEEEEEEEDISLKMDILSALKSLEEADSTFSEDTPAIPTSPVSKSATAMSLDKDPWEILDQGIDVTSSKSEMAEIKKTTRNLIINEERKLPKDFTPIQLFKQAVSDLTSILDSIGELD